MPEVSLQDYLQDIDRLIEDSHLDEAVRHCRHILRQFPRHVETYRLLGKALLEDQHMAGARDVFQRVLSAEPEDFIAHAGLAIIHKENNDLVDAAWHMQRAFEVEPYNGAIREALQDLVGRRDGLPPEELTLSRGALARLHVRGGLYVQAIAELRELLAEAPDRVDLQVLLAEALWRNGQRIDAADECSRILERLPYCVKANAILAEVWLVTDRVEDAQSHLRTVFELVLPTASALDEDTVVSVAFRTEGSPVLPEKISVERLSQDGGPGSQEDAADWVQDIDLGEELVLEDAEPDWLGALQDETFAPEGKLGAFDEVSEANELVEQADVAADDEMDAATSWFSRSSDQLPGIGDLRQETDWEDWLGDSPQLDASARLESQHEDADSEIEEASMAGNDQQNHEREDYPENNETQRPEGSDSSEESTDLGWLDELQDASQPSGTGELANDEAGRLPDWLSSGEELEDIEAVDLDWLEELEERSETERDTPSATGEDLPDWLRDELASEGSADEAEAGDDLSWLDQIAAGEGPPLEEPPTMSWPDADISDEDEREQPPVVDDQGDEEVDQLGISASDEPDRALLDEDYELGDDVSDDDVPEDIDEAMAWLEQLAAQQGAPPEELPSLATSPETTGEEAPEDIASAMDWLDELAYAQDEAGYEPLAIGEQPSPADEEAQDLGDVPPADEAAEVGEVAVEAGIGRPEVPDEATEFEEDISEMDEAMAWLEELAVEGEPDDEVAMIDELEGQTYAKSMTELDDVPEDPEQALAWLEGLASEPPTEEGEATAGAVVEEDSTPPAPMDVVAARAEAEAILRQDETLGEQVPQDDEMLEDIPDDPDEAMAWLEKLAARQGASLDELPSLSGVEEEVAEADWLIAEDESARDEEITEMAAGSEATFGAVDVEISEEPVLEDTAIESEAFEVTEFEEGEGESADVEIEGDEVDVEAFIEDEAVPEEIIASLDSDAALPDWLMGEAEEEFGEFDWDDEEFDATGWLASEEAVLQETDAEDVATPDVTEEAVEAPESYPAIAEEPEVGEEEEAPAGDTDEPEPAVVDGVAAEAGEEPSEIDVTEALPTAGDESVHAGAEEAIKLYERRLEEGKDPATLIEDLEQAVQDYGDEPRLLQLLGDAYNHNGQLQRALDAYRRALEML